MWTLEQSDEQDTCTCINIISRPKKVDFFIYVKLTNKSAHANSCLVFGTERLFANICQHFLFSRFM